MISSCRGYTVTRALVLVVLFLCLCTGCADDPSIQHSYRPPEDIGDGLVVGTLAEMGVDSVLVAQAVESIRKGQYTEVHSLLVVKGTTLVVEEYFDGHRFEYDSASHHGNLVTWDRTMSHRVMSVTKSITSACVGIAVDKGFIESVHQSIFDYLPDHQHLMADGKEAITIEHLLTMTSGLHWNEWAIPYGNPHNDVIKTFYADDPVAYYLEKPLLDPPGTSFNYAGGSNNVLGEIVRNATGTDIAEFSGTHLFGPLGIDPYHWSRYRNGEVDAAGSIEITPRDMAKIGVTFLHDGSWNGDRIISEEWVERSATPYPGNSWTNNWNDHYGMKGYAYSWWTHHFVWSGKRVDMFHAAGWGGQTIMVIPALDAVVVFTGGNYLTVRPAFEILKKYIVPALG